MHLARALRTPQKLADTVTSSIPRTMFLLVPIFAGIVAIAYRDRRRRYPQHLAFALHAHAVLFLGLAVMLASRLMPNYSISHTFWIAGAAAIALHLVAAARRVYDRSLANTLARLVVVSTLYFAAFLGALYLTFALTVLEF